MRIRTIKPAFFKDEKLAELPPLTRILFTGLWGLADSEGRLEYRPKYIEAEVMPYDDCDVAAMLKSLSDARFIQVYPVGRRSIIQVINFKKHQKIPGREALIPSEYPNPPMRENSGKFRKEKYFPKQHSSTKSENSGKFRKENSFKEGKGREGNGKEGNGLPAANDAPETSLVPVDKSVTAKPLHSPQAEFIDRFKAFYEAMTGEKFKADKHHYVIAAKLIKDYGYEAAVVKAKTLGQLCRDKSTWFTKGGWGDYTIEKLSSQWNSVLPTTRGDSAEGKANELLTEMKKQEALSAIASGRDK